MKISIVVPAFNEEKLIGETLRRITTASEAFSRQGCDWELIVCDNNSSDRTAELARAASANVVFEPVNQIGRARNTGAKAATGDWLLFIDADSHPRPELFSEVAAAIQSGRCLAGGSTIRLDEASFRGRIVMQLWNFISRTTKSLAGSFIFCDAQVFWSVGGFNPELFVTEELDLSKRLRKLAARSRKKIIILHRHPLITSARKLRLYSGVEHLRFLFKSALGLGRTFKSPAECHIWYDGRR